MNRCVETKLVSADKTVQTFRAKRGWVEIHMSPENTLHFFTEPTTQQEGHRLFFLDKFEDDIQTFAEIYASPPRAQGKPPVEVQSQKRRHPVG